MYKINITIALLLISCFCKGQDDIQITNYFHAKPVLNPSYTGSSGNINALILARQQWLGYESAPSTQFVNIDTYFDRIGGIGLMVTNDMLGNERSLRFRLNYCLKYNFSRYTSFAVGIGGGFVNSAFNAVNLVYEEFDPGGIYSDFTAFMPETTGGVNFSHKYFSLGFSMVRLFNSTNDEIVINTPDYYHAYLEIKYDINDKFIIQPSAYWHSTLLVSSIEAGVMTIYDKKIHGGVAYRLNDAIMGMIGYQISDKLRIGYSYDFTLGDLKSYSSGSHEIFINFSVKKPEKQYFYYKSPRHF